MPDPPTRPTRSRSRATVAAYCLFGLAVLLFILTGVILDSSLNRLSLAQQRWVTFLALVLPAVLGMLIGLVALVRPEQRSIRAVIPIILNALFAAFFIAVLAIAG